MNPFNYVRPEFRPDKYRPFKAIQKEDRRWPSAELLQAPKWCSVDLRDGNQALIDPMTVEQKKMFWQLLVRMGFKEIEVGFPAASQPDFDFVRWLIEDNQIPSDVTIQVLVQARKELIERTFEALQGASRAIVHLYNSTSPVQRKKVFNLDKAGIREIAQRGAEYVRDQAQTYPGTDWVFQYSPESFSTTEVDFALEVCNVVIDVWKPTPEHKTIINLPATVESSMPNRFADQVEYFIDGIHCREAIDISIHTHNDRGCAVAAAEMALLAGADRIEGTLLGNGERTGNMDIITLAMNLYSQGVDPMLDLSFADDIISTVERCTAIKTHPRHPWFGELVYTAFSGSHQDAIRKCLSLQQEGEPWDVAYLPIDPQDLGRSYQSVIRVNSQSGKGGASYLVEQSLGFQMPRWVQIEFAQPVQLQAERLERELQQQEIIALFQRTYMTHRGEVQLDSYQLEGHGQRHQIQANLNEGDHMRIIHGQGNGAISAFTDAIQKALGMHLQVVQFDEQSCGQDSNADAAAFVQVNIDGKRFTGVAIHEDTLTAGINALLATVNQALTQHQQAA